MNNRFAFHPSSISLSPMQVWKGGCGAMSASLCLIYRGASSPARVRCPEARLRSRNWSLRIKMDCRRGCILNLHESFLNAGIWWWKRWGWALWNIRLRSL